jgi:quercetin dioxygenase-like cupin family protein
MPEHLNMPSASDMHSSDTVDVNILLSGSLDCVLSDQSVVKLTAGDMIVLNGAEHSWHNSSAEEAVMLFFLTGASRK